MTTPRVFYDDGHWSIEPLLFGRARILDRESLGTW